MSAKITDSGGYYTAHPTSTGQVDSEFGTLMASQKADAADAYDGNYTFNFNIECRDDRSRWIQDSKRIW